MSGLASSLGSLSRHAGASLPLPEISPERLRAWLESGGWAPRTRAGLLTDAKTFLGWCLRREWIAANPALAVDRPRIESKAGGVHTPAQVRTVLRVAYERDGPLCRFLALLYFSGLRWSEATRTTESDIRGGFIHVPAERSKTRARRVVEIQPALAAWLEATPGRLPLSNVVKRWRKVRTAAGVPWPPNVTRHSFCSYHLAHFGNAAKTALEAGHAESVLFRHYRESVSRESAAEFWGIRPSCQPPQVHTEPAGVTLCAGISAEHPEPTRAAPSNATA